MSVTNLELPYSIDPKNPFLVDKRSGPWASVNAANAGIPEAVRVRGLVVIVLDAVVGYYYKDGVADVNLVPINTDESAIWGQITGVLSNQTDLQAALDGKEDDITPGTTLQFWRGDKTWQTLNTAVVPESGSLYFTEARARAALSLTTTGNNGAATYTGGVFNIPVYSLAGLGGEPTIAAGTNLQYWRGDKTWQTLNTDAVPEATAKYYTDARVLAFGDTQWVRLDGSYTNPSWLVSLPWSKITNTPTTLAGYGITDAFTETEADARFVKKAGDTMSGNLLIAAPASIDSSLVPGEDILNLGTANASVINIGWSGATINIQGSVMWQDVDNLAVTDKLIRLNKGGAAASGVSSGFEIEENAVITGWLATDSTRTGWDLKAPASQQLTLGLDLLTASRTIKVPNLTGTLLIDSGTYNDPAWLATLAWSKITGTPTTLSGYGITNAYTKTETDSLLSAYTPMTRQLTINGVTQDLLANRTWSVGTVTSVGLAVPTGFTSGASVSSSGNLTLGFDAGYSLPTNVKQGQWDTAFGWGNWAASSHYIGTTLIANNRASGAQTLTGVSIDGNAGTATLAANSTLLQGYSAVVASTANTVALRDGSGYLRAVYFYDDNVAVAGSGITSMYGGTGDKYMYKFSAAAVQAFLGLGSMAYASTSSYVPTAGYSFGTAFTLGTMFNGTTNQAIPTNLIGGYSNGYIYNYTLAQIQSWLGLGSYAYRSSGLVEHLSSIANFNTLYYGGFYQGFNTTGRPGVGGSLDWGLVNIPVWTGNNPAEWYALQISAQISNGTPYVRMVTNGTGTWYSMLTEANYNNWAPSLTGSGASGNWNINAATATTFSTNRTNYRLVTDGAVAGQLMWKEYGNNHTIFDASDSTAPDGTAVDAQNSAVPWAGTYPTLMGWNGATTYGVRVDSARVSDLWNGLAISLSTYSSGTVPSALIYNSTNSRVEFGTWAQYQTWLGLGSYVPYTGATAHLNMGGWNVSGYSIIATNAFLSDNYYRASGVPMMAGTSSYTMLYNQAGSVSIYLGGAVDPANYYDNTSHFFRSIGGAANYTVINSNGLTITTGRSLYLDQGDIQFTSNSGYGILTQNGTRGLIIQNGQITMGTADLQIAARTLRFDESGVRSWSLGISSGNLYFNSGDGGGYHIFQSTGLSANHFDAVYASPFGSYNGKFDWNLLQLGNNGPNYIVGGHNVAGGWLDFFVNNTNRVPGTTPNGIHAMRIDPDGTLRSYVANILYNSVQSPNHCDIGAANNVNLGGPSGRGVVAGYSGGGYSGIGYNIQHTTSSGYWNAPGSDTVSYVVFDSGFSFYYAPSGVAGRDISGTLQRIARISSGGYFITRGEIYPGYNNASSGEQSTYYLYGNTASGGIRTNGALLANTDIYLGTRGTWLSSWLDQAVTTTSRPTFLSLRADEGFTSASAQGRFGGWYNGVGFTGAAVEVGYSSGEGYAIAYNRNTSAYSNMIIAGTNVKLQPQGGAITATGNIVMSDYGLGLVGQYNSTLFQAVYAMGESYMLPSGGGSTGSLYGLAWAHPNAGGQAANLSSHGLLVVVNGVTRAAISGNMWLEGTATATSFNGNWNGFTYSNSGGANTMVQRDASGYIWNSYFYMSSGGAERNASGLGYFAGFNSSDYYVRSYTPTAARAAMGLATTDNVTFNTGFFTNGASESDINLKNIRGYGSELNIADQIRVIRFHWKDAAKGTALKFGYEAQWVDQLMPNAVMRNQLGNLSVDYQQVHTVLIDENTRRIQALEAEVASLKQQLNNRA